MQYVKDGISDNKVKFGEQNIHFNKFMDIPMHPG